MRLQVDIDPKLLRWARERADRSASSLAARFPKLELWERGEARPTLRQLEQLAKAIHTPVGYLFLPSPLLERIPLPDFRTFWGAPVKRRSPDLLDTLYLCQPRQDWYRGFARSIGEPFFPFVGSVRFDSDLQKAAEGLQEAPGFNAEERHRVSIWTEALRLFIAKADALGILVMINGVVGNNNLSSLRCRIVASSEQGKRVGDNSKRRPWKLLMAKTALTATAAASVLEARPQSRLSPLRHSLARNAMPSSAPYYPFLHSMMRRSTSHLKLILYPAIEPHSGTN